MSISTSTLLAAQKLTCIREDRILFEKLDFTVSSGDIIQIEGPNGAGKTSLLRILAGLSQPYEGDVLFNKCSINNDKENYNKHLLYIGHLAGIKGEMSAQENLQFNLALSGLNSENAEQALSEVNLLGFEDALASHLSAGQHRRIALAKLWQSNAPVWILDEPFTAIDKYGVRTLEGLIINHAEKGGCVILTTHQDLAMDKNLYKKLTLEYRFF